jgi:prevent-host-death family protein
LEILMGIEVGAFEAKTKLSQLLELVRQGERVTITKHGVPVAVLVPPREVRRERTADVVRELTEIRQRTKRGRETLRKLREAGRRF